MLVTTAKVGDSIRNERSLSSASTTIRSLLPRRAFEPIAPTTPPTTTVGSRPACAEHGRDHRGRRRLPVRAGDGDRVRLESHQLGQHLGARDDGDRAPPRFEHFGVVVAHGGRAHDDVRAADVLRRVPLVNLRAQLLRAAPSRPSGAGPSPTRGSPCSKAPPRCRTCRCRRCRRSGRVGFDET